MTITNSHTLRPITLYFISMVSPVEIREETNNFHGNRLKRKRISRGILGTHFAYASSGESFLQKSRNSIKKKNDE